MIWSSNASALALAPTQEISILESWTTLYQDDIYLINYYSSLLKWVEEICPVQEINAAKNYASNIIWSLDAKYAKLSIWEKLHESKQLHDKLLAFQSTLNRLWGEHYCTLKYILFSAQSHLRDFHISIMQDTWIIRDFDGFILGWSIHGQAAKMEIMNNYIAELLPYEKILGSSIDFQSWDNVTSPNQWWLNIANHSKRIMELTVYKALVELTNAWLFTDADIEELRNKFVLNLHLSCDSFHGNYKVTETFSHTWDHIHFETDEVPLDVNVCWNYFLLKDLPFHFYKIVIHELGHHFYYYHDRLGHDDFEAICWSWNQCGVNDFASDYAQTEAIEDYAEHFMHRFIWLDMPSSPIIDLKNQHFNRF